MWPAYVTWGGWSLFFSWWTSRRWIPLSHSRTRDDTFLMSSSYHSLLASSIFSSQPSSIGNLFIPFNWGSWAPLKVIVFSWQLLLDKFSYIENLLKRKVIMDFGVTLCLICGVFVESALHLFITYDLVSSVVYMILSWLAWQTVLPRDPSLFFEYFLSLVGSVLWLFNKLVRNWGEIYFFDFEMVFKKINRELLHLHKFTSKPYHVD